MSPVRFSCIIVALVMAASGLAHARTGPAHGPGGHESSVSVGADGLGAAYELDRRSHPALRSVWAELARGDLNRAAGLDPALAPLGAALLLHAEQDWVLLWLDDEAARSLRHAGVRLSPPRPRPPASPRISLPAVGGAGDRRDALVDPAVLDAFAHAVNQDEMMGHLDVIATQLQTRYYMTNGMQAATQYVYDRFVEYGLDQVYFDTFSYAGHTVRNVVGVKTGTTYPSRKYMICGHLDSTSGQPQTLAPGAEDNGSGSVAVLEAARLLAPLETESTVYFVCFTAEEQGLVGSAHLAQIADQENWDLRGVLNMDMVGYDTAGPPDLWIEGFPGNPNSVALMDALEATANAYTDMAIYRYPNNGWGSDHVPFNDRGFASLLAIDYDWDNYGCYHQTCDVVANIVPSQLRRMTVAVTLTGAQLAGLRATNGVLQGVADRTDAPDDSGIRVELAGTAFDAVTTAADGSFSMAAVFPGTYTIRASAAGYESAEDVVTIVGGQTTQVALALEPLQPSIVNGRVTADLGGSTAGAIVFAESQEPFAIVAADGSYSLGPIAPGPNVLTVSKAGRMPAVRIVDLPSGEQVGGVDFVLKTIWNLEASNDGLAAGLGWEWGNDQQWGAHSGTKIWETKLNSLYENCADYRLDLPPLDLRFYQNARLRFWHAYRTEAGRDGGNVQVSTDGGTTWTVAQPSDGYSGMLSGTCNVLAGRPGYTGQQVSWTEDTVDLSAYAGRSIRVRFWFGSDSGTRDRGWAIDDLVLEGDIETAGADEGSTAASVPATVTVAPNPASGGTARVTFVLTAEMPVWVDIFDASGRHVRTLVRDEAMPAGPRSVGWDGRNDAGERAASGAYWARVFSGGRTSFGQFVRIAER